MQVVYVPNDPPESYSKSIFLAGPSPRLPDHLNWRIEALQELERRGYDGVVYVPLPEDGDWSYGYDMQVAWEVTNLDRADQIVFWIPRNMATLPGLTTNVEFGRYFDSGRVVLGYPQDACHMNYLATIAASKGVLSHRSLDGTLIDAMTRIGDGALRTGGERDVPLGIWKLPHFQGWYQSQKAAGNRLDGAKVLFTFRVGPNRGFTFAFILHVNMFIAGENRSKKNEFVVSRPDIATIVAYYKPSVTLYSSPQDVHFETSWSYLQDTEVAIIREFRSPARTQDGYIREVPGGSSWKPGEWPEKVMGDELEEETGLGPKSGFNIDPSRIRKVGTRQLCGTLSAHQAHTFACKLTWDEMAFLRQQQRDNIVHGVEADTERTYVEVHRLGDLVDGASDHLDWSMLGQILTAILIPG